MKTRTVFCQIFAVVMTAVLLMGAGQQATTPKPAAPQPPTMRIDLDRALRVAMPNQLPPLKPVAFKTPDGKEGWAIRIPGARPIATPAFSNGKIFVGGGYGSHEFYAFDAATGALAWQVKTGDDGPSAAVVEQGRVIFNTESCTIYVLDEKTGKVIWQQWLGDPLMSQPAIYKGVVYMAYPGGQRRAGVASQSKNARSTHRLVAIELETGRHIWEQEITGDVIAAPVISDGKVYITCFDGTSFAFEAADGKLLWKKAGDSTSAPSVSYGGLMVTRRVRNANGATMEGTVRMDSEGKEKDPQPLHTESAEYIKEGKSVVALSAPSAGQLDSSVGFSTPPAAAKIAGAKSNVGVASVVGGWAYQGPKYSLNRGAAMNAQGRYLKSVNAADGKLLWRAEVSGKNLDTNAQLFAPPALGKDYMYVGGVGGYLLSLRQSDGAVSFAYAFQHPIAFQPALARGAVYFGTIDGLVICLKTGATDADGWHAWGGNAQHNR